jgi:hypothetical protein
MALDGYTFERLCMVSYIVPCFYMALFNPGYYNHLTYWTLLVHCVYYTVDKSSPKAASVARVLHGMSFCGAWAVMVGYTFISVTGGIHWGGWLQWENAVGRNAGTVTGERGFTECFLQKFYEHYWPIAAAALDVQYSRGELTRIYAGCSPSKMLLLGMGAYFAVGLIWEGTCAANQGNVLTVYQQGPAMSSTYLMGLLGVKDHGLKEDFVFVTTQKVLLISCAAFVYMRSVAPLMAGGKQKGA